MADAFARLEWMGRQVLCYLQPGCEVADMEALAGDIADCCTDCCTDSDLDAEMDAVAARHHLRVARGDPGAPRDRSEGVVTFGFLPPVRIG